MNHRPSDLFNKTDDIALTKSIQTKALASERNAQERALIGQYGAVKEITYISKDGRFQSNDLDELIQLMNQDKQYKE